MDIKIFTPETKKNILVNIHLLTKDKKFSKIFIFPMKLIMSSYYEFLNSLFEDLNEKFVDNLKNFNYFNVLLEKLFLRFSHSYNNFQIFDFISNQADNIFFIIPKNFKIHHFISKNKISFILEIMDTNKIKIYCK